MWIPLLGSLGQPNPPPNGLIPSRAGDRTGGAEWPYRLGWILSGRTSSCRTRTPCTGGGDVRCWLHDGSVSKEVAPVRPYRWSKAGRRFQGPSRTTADGHGQDRMPVRSAGPPGYDASSMRHCDGRSPHRAEPHPSAIQKTRPREAGGMPEPGAAAMRTAYEALKRTCRVGRRSRPLTYEHCLARKINL
jgi:hypothetical protein